MKRWGIVLAALLLTVGCALADDGGSGLDNERAQAIYWEYSGAVIEDYAEVETAGRTFAFILFKQEQRRMMKVYFDSEFGWTDWFVTAEGVPQGGRGRLETDGESVTVSAADRSGGLRTITYAWDAAMPNEPKGTEESRKQFVGGFRLTAYDGARVDTDGVIHFAEGDAKVELLNDMRYLAYGNLPKNAKRSAGKQRCAAGIQLFQPALGYAFRAGCAAFGESQPQGLSGARQGLPAGGERQGGGRHERLGAGVRPIRRLAADSIPHRRESLPNRLD